MIFQYSIGIFLKLETLAAEHKKSIRVIKKEPAVRFKYTGFLHNP